MIVFHVQAGFCVKSGRWMYLLYLFWSGLITQMSKLIQTMDVSCDHIWTKSEKGTNLWTEKDFSDGYTILYYVIVIWLFLPNHLLLFCSDVIDFSPRVLEIKMLWAKLNYKFSEHKGKKGFCFDNPKAPAGSGLSIFALFLFFKFSFFV